MDSLKLNKAKLLVTLLFADNSVLMGNVFLDTRSRLHEGREFIKDVLESDEPFFPLEESREKTILFIKKSSIVKVTLHAREILDEPAFSQKKSVTIITLFGGESISGKLSVSLPRESSRVSDFINQPAKFVYILKEKNDVLVNLNYVKTIQQIS